MNKSKIILASLGGVIGLVSLVLAYFVWDAITVKGERMDELDGLTAAAEHLTRLPVYPSPAGVKAYGENAAAFSRWREEAVRVAATGDKTFEATTPPAFKTFLISEAQRLSALPGAVDGKIVKPGFPFGFKDYITGGVLPAPADLPRLQREWHDVAAVIETLSACGVSEIVDVAVAAAKPAAEETKSEDPRRNRRNASRSRAKAETEASAGPAPLISTFTIDFLARPLALVNAVNAFVTTKRFIVVTDFSFTRETDEVGSAIDAGKGNADEASKGRRGRRGRRGAALAEEKKDAEGGEKKGFFTDPLKAPPLKVKMTFSVYDFRSLETKPETETKSEVKK
jgi:hypothetical protein